MKVRLKICLLCLLALVAAWFFWPTAKEAARRDAASGSAPMAVSTSSAAKKSVDSHNKVVRSAASTNREAFRLTNTAKQLDELVVAPHAVILENALVDTDAKNPLVIPQHLRAAGEPGAYIVQARGKVDAAFRAVLTAAGAEIVSYIPNNAYLVQLPAAGAGVLSGNPSVQAVLPWEPYYKIQSSLLGRAVQEKKLLPGQMLTLGLFATGAEATAAKIQKLGGLILGTDSSPFGPVVRVQPGADWVALARLPGVLRVEQATHRELANDLARVTMAISVDTVTNVNWMGLSGSNIMVVVADTGVDATHPDFNVAGSASSPGPNPANPSRVTGDNTNSLYDTAGHGTHVAGVLAGNGSMSRSPVNVGSQAQGSVTNADFRGKAPSANLFSLGFLGHDNGVSDFYLQAMAALTNALISNNSWDNGANEYDLSAASYDAAVRDSLPTATGPQPVLYVFPAGNQGNGDDQGFNGNSDSITSPGTAKNVITVGALEQFRDITNQVTFYSEGVSDAVWETETSSSNEVANYSSRGNVGIGTEGTFGRFKPDVVAPGNFVVSTRPSMWDKAAYYNPTNTLDVNSLYNITLDTNQLASSGGYVPPNAVGIQIFVQANQNSLTPFPTNFPIYFSTGPSATPSNYDIATSNNVLNIPPGGGTITSITPLLDSFFTCSVGNPTNRPINFNFIIHVLTTNDDNSLTVLSNLNETLGPWYFYESGTSIATPAVSGSLALLGDYFTNTLHTNATPALLKAMLINGARLTTGYTTFAVNTNINYEGWGLVDVPNSIPAGVTNTANVATTGTPMFFMDQSPTNALASGDRRTYTVTVPTAAARNQQYMRLTLAWTDPPGNPAAGIKLVNNLDLVVTNLDNGKVYYGNNFIQGVTPVSAVVTSNTVPDNINNVESIWLAPPLSTNYTVTVYGHNVAVNAVTLEQTNIVQDFALVVSSGGGTSTNGVVVAPLTPSLVSGTNQAVTYIVSYTNGPVFNQISGANAPWLSTNSLLINSGLGFGTNAALQYGQTNQWHFFVVTNTTLFTNAAFVVFQPETLSVSRMGVFTGEATNATTPEADLNMFVAPGQPGTGDPTASALLNLDNTVISNCVYNVNNDQASIGRGGTKFIIYSNATPQQVYYIGVQCNDQTAGEFGFFAQFSKDSFSKMQNGNQIVDGLQLPVNIPDGSNLRGGVAYVFGLAAVPMTLGDITVTNTITHENYGDLIGGLTHNAKGVVLNNHDGLGSGTITRVYNDTGLLNTVPSDGPGSLKSFVGSETAGLWQLTEVDDSQTKTGAVSGLTLAIRPHIDLTKGLQTVFVPAGSWFYEYVDVPVGYTNMLIVATNITVPPLGPVQLYLNDSGPPTQTSYLIRADLNKGVPPGNSISYGPPLQPGRYYIGLFNPSAVGQNVLIGVFLSFNSAAITRDQFVSSGPVPLLDDAVTYDSIFVNETNRIEEFSVGLRVDHQRISDLVFTLFSPDGDRYLLMENRGGQTTNGCGVTVITTNIFYANANGNGAPQTNSFDTGKTAGTLPITYDFYSVPDQMTVYYGTNAANFTTNSPYLLLNTGFTNNPNGPVTVNVSYPPSGIQATSTFVTIIMNQFGNPAGTNGTQWTYTAGSVQTNFYYLTFTEDTNYTTTPIKYAVPPFNQYLTTNTVIITNLVYATNGTTTNLSSFDSVTAGSYSSGNLVDGWTVNTNQVSVVNDPVNANSGSQFLALANGAMTHNISVPFGSSNVLTYAQRGPGIAAWWRAENNGNDSINGNNATNMQNITYPAGEKGNAFQFDGTTSLITAPPSTSTAVTNVTLEAWVYLPNLTHPGPVFDYGGSGEYANISMWVNTTGFGNQPGALHGILRNPLPSPGGGIDVSISSQVLSANQWNHIAFTADVNSRVGNLYCNGNLVATATSPIPVTPQTFEQVNLGYRAATLEALFPSFFQGNIDEASIYNRALSASEIKAISLAGTAGKYDSTEFSSSPSLSLSKASANLAGFSTNTFFANNNVWLTNTITFIPETNSLSLTMTGLQPGTLLDSFTLTTYPVTTNYVTNVVVVATNIYYQPEQDISSLKGKNPYGTWTLEVLDNRTGATNNAVLQSWALNITVAHTNFTTGINTNIGNGPITNFIPGGGLQWYLVDVPTNADFATNTLIFADLPLNMWWSTNAPPTITNAPDKELLTTVTSGSSVLGTNPPVPPFITPGGQYYLGIQNPNVAGANYAIDVTFHLFIVLAPPSVITLAASNITLTTATLDGSVNPNGLPTTAWFDWGTDTNYTLGPTPLIQLTNNLGLWQLITNGVTNLTPGMTYHFRAAATNALGTNYGADFTFVAALPPYAYTAPATLQNGASAQLNGFATPNGTPAFAWFEFGTSPAYGVRTPSVAVGSGMNVVFVTNIIASLTTNIPYHYRLVVSNYAGTNYGYDQVFDQANVAAWGADFQGQTTPLPASLTNLVVGIGAGYNFSLALNNDGSVVAWGDDTFGQTNVPIGLTNAVSVSGGYKVSLALRSDRGVSVWGSPQFRQTQPFVPASLTNAIAAVSGDWHCLALRDNGNVVGWGNSSLGQTNVPAGLTNVVSVAAGGFHSLALNNDGTVVAWGDNTYGQTNVPAGLSNVVAVAGGELHSLALLTNGTVVAWGDNSLNQTNVPSSVTNVLAIAAGGFHSLALKKDGTVVQWGDSSAGQLPTFTTNLSNVVAIAGSGGGGFHSLALTSLVGINQTNTPPFWTNGLNGTTVMMNEMTTLLVTNIATDTNTPAQVLQYSLVNPPAFANINPFTGIITLTPGEIDGPSTNTITTVVSDNGFPSLSATNSFTLVVNEVNRAPFWPTNVPASTNFTIGVGTTLTVTNTASDLDIPTNALFYSVSVSSGTNVPAITTNGIITWTPTLPGSFVLTTIVTDTNPWAINAKSLSATNYIFVTVTNTAPPATNINISSIVFTNIGGTNGFLLTWFAPSNDLFQVQWTASLPATSWNTFTNPPAVSYNTNVVPVNPTNAQFNFFDDGSQTGGLGSMRFYRLILLQSANTLTLPPQTNLTVSAGSLVTVTNTATDSSPSATITYSLVNPPAGASIDTNGVITWTNATPSGLAARFTTVATDNGTPSASATNTFTVFVLPLPAISGITVTATNVVLSWSAPTNDQFNVQWTTNLLSPWNTFPGIVTSPTSAFNFTDTNLPLVMKFYRLILLP